MIVIPEELIALASERRIIPFLGAGFSDSLGLPGWDDMLRTLCGRIEGSLTFDELYKATGGDYLQIAEYLYLKSDKRIGPLRRHIDRALVATEPILKSGPHVELVNLGPQQIYTTNYDDLIENTYRALGLPVDVVVLPKDIALANPKKTQVVKYHGDLEHEETLVLTESAYYRRLDFDSPMDLKFRSDLLGKSVLFMGYSFRDVNIRVIWFKLMDMMRDIPEGDRRPSYIVRLNANPALEDLYAAVGIRTIVLSPDDPVGDAKERAGLLAQFLLQLTEAAGTVPVSAEDAHERGRVIVSPALLQEPYRDFRGELKLDELLQFGGLLQLTHPRVSRMVDGFVPDILRDGFSEAFTELVPLIELDSAADYVRIIDLAPPSANLTAVVVRVLASQGDRPPRELRRQLVGALPDWRKIWASKLPTSYARRVLERLESEMVYQAREGADEDIAYLTDIGARLAAGILTDDANIRAEAGELLKASDAIYPSVAEYLPDPEGPPQVGRILAEVEARATNFEAIPWLAPKMQRIRATALERARSESGPARPQVASAPKKRPQAAPGGRARSGDSGSSS